MRRPGRAAILPAAILPAAILPAVTLPVATNTTEFRAEAVTLSRMRDGGSLHPAFLCAAIGVSGAEFESMYPKAPAYRGFFIEKKPPCTLSARAL
jgi:hypothetical protein